MTSAYTPASTVADIHTEDGLVLRATMTTAGAGRDPVDRVVILSHGSGPTSSRFRGSTAALAARLTAAGVSTVCYDFRGHGESEGRQCDVTLTTGLTDLRAVIAAVRASEWAKGARLALAGTSYGGAVSLLAGADLPDLTALALRAPVTDLLPLAPPTRARGPLAALFADAVNHDLYTAASRVQCPVLVVHGTRDTVVPVAQSDRLVQEIGGPVDYCRIEGADHRFGSVAHNEQAVAAMATWISACLDAPRYPSTLAKRPA